MNSLADMLAGALAPAAAQGPAPGAAIPPAHLQAASAGAAVPQQPPAIDLSAIMRILGPMLAQGGRR